MARILLAEDEAHILRIMSLWLRRHGHEVHEATNGAEAVEILDRLNVDVIVSDLNMPKIDGFGLLSIVRNERRLATPFFLLTARCDHVAMAEQIKPLKARLYPKPFVPSRLVLDIEKALEIPVA